MSKYAQDTSVSVEKSVTEIDAIVGRFGADEFGYGRNSGMGMVFFRLRDRQVRFTVPLPAQDDKKYTLTETGRRRTASAAVEAWNQDVRRQWRALALVIKAKLVAVEDGVVTFEQEFGMHFVLPGGKTVADVVAPEIEAAYATGKVRPMLQIESS